MLSINMIFIMLSIYMIFYVKSDKIQRNLSISLLGSCFMEFPDISLTFELIQFLYFPDFQELHISGHAMFMETNGIIDMF